MNKIELYKNTLPFNLELTELHADLQEAIIFSVTGKKKTFTFDELLKRAYGSHIQRLVPRGYYIS